MKIKRLAAVILSIVLALSVTACGSTKSYKVDWAKCSQQTKNEFVGNKSYSYVKDLQVSEKDGMLIFSIVVDDATKPSLAPKLAETVLRRYNSNAQLQDSSVAGGSKTSRGGLYDTYQVNIAVAPNSKVDGDKSEWFVNDTIGSGVQMQHEIKLQKAYQ